MGRRSVLEQEFYEQLRDQGVDETTADVMARDWAEDTEEGW